MHLSLRSELKGVSKTYKIKIKFNKCLIELKNLINYNIIHKFILYGNFHSYNLKVKFKYCKFQQYFILPFTKNALSNKVIHILQHFSSLFIVSSSL